MMVVIDALPNLTRLVGTPAREVATLGAKIQMAAGLPSALALAFGLGEGSRPLSTGAALASCLKGHWSPFLHLPDPKYLQTFFLLGSGLVERLFPLPLPLPFPLPLPGEGERSPALAS